MSMIKVNYNKTVNVSKTLFSLNLDGHAGYNPGNDIVCAGVSALIETLISLIEDDEEISIFEESGDVSIEGTIDNSDIEKYLEFAITGIKGISMTYPEHVDFKEQIKYL